MKEQLFTKRGLKKLNNPSEEELQQFKDDDEFLKLCYETHLQKDEVNGSGKLKDFIPKVNVSEYARQHNISRPTAHKRLLGKINQGCRQKHNFVVKHRDKIIDIINHNEVNGTNKVKHVYRKFAYQYNELAKQEEKIEMCSYVNFLKFFNEDLELVNMLEKRNNNKKKVAARVLDNDGVEAQFDYKQCMNITFATGDIIPIHVFEIILTRSKYRISFLTLTLDQVTLFDMIVRACDQFGFVPNILLTDNMKTIMDKANESFNSGGIQNDKAAEFAKDIGGIIIAGTKHRPETKSTVETQMKTLDQLKLNKGVATLEGLSKELMYLDKVFNSETKDSLITINEVAVRILPFKDISQDRLIAERMNMSKITAAVREKYLIKGETRAVDFRSLIKFNRICYSLPAKYRSKKVRIVVQESFLLIFDIDTNDLITAHKIQNEYPHSLL